MVTQQQIARKLGVSRQLVTFALSGYPHVSARSRDRILAAARKMGYRPNPHSRALRRSRTGILGLWIPDHISTHYSRVFHEMNRLVTRAGQELIVTEIGAAGTGHVLSHVPVDGVFVVDSPAEVLRLLKTPGAVSVPLVSLGAYYLEDTDVVRVDLAAGTREMMKHLIGIGCRRIAHATFVTKESPQTARLSGYLKAMKAARLRPEFIHYSATERLRPMVRRVIRHYVARHGFPDAIFCHSDDAALGIYRGLCDMNVRVPEDVALAGCDGIHDTEYLERPVTTIAQPLKEMCATAWKFLSDRLERPRRAIQRAVLRPKLMIRQSTERTTGSAPARRGRG